MLSKTIIDSDAFLDMPQSTQLLYFHMSMRADDDGFVNNPKSIMRNVKCSEDDVKVLISKKFIIPFESGVVVIKHWKIHNYIAKDRYKETKYKNEKANLKLDENNSYTLKDSSCTECVQGVYELETQVRLGKDRLGKDSIDILPSVDEIIVSYTENELLIDTIYDFIDMRNSIKTKTSAKAMKLILNKLDKICKNDSEKIEVIEQSIMNNWKGIFEIKRKLEVDPKKFNNFEPAKSDEEILKIEQKLLGWDKDE